MSPDMDDIYQNAPGVPDPQDPAAAYRKPEPAQNPMQHRIDALNKRVTDMADTQPVAPLSEEAPADAVAEGRAQAFSRESAGWTMACYIHDRIDHATRVCNTLAQAIEAKAKEK